MPRAVVADEHQLVGFALRQRDAGQRSRGGGGLQQVPTI